MVSHDQIRLACRARALTVAVCTTGSTTLSATSTGYARTAGSFLTDGFRVGMEVAPTGFTETATGVITGVTALTMTIDGGRTTQGAAAARTLAVGLPATRGWENVAVTPTAGVPYIVESYIPGALAKTGMGENGTLDVLPLYTLQLWGPAGRGVGAISALTDALLTHFAPTTPLTLTNGDVARVRSQPAPTPSALFNPDAAWGVVTLTIPLRLSTLNSR